MTQRDTSAQNLMSLVSLAAPRGDTPPTLPAPAQSGVGGCDPVSFDSKIATPSTTQAEVPVSRPNDSIEEGNLPGFLYVAMRSDLAVSAPEERPAIVARVKTIKTRAQASEYMEEVRVKIRTARNISSR
jgi:phospholipase C